MMNLMIQAPPDNQPPDAYLTPKSLIIDLNLPRFWPQLCQKLLLPLPTTGQFLQDSCVLLAGRYLQASGLCLNRFETCVLEVREKPSIRLDQVLCQVAEAKVYLAQI